MKRIGVIIGRFQIPKLHDGHRHLIDYVLSQSDYVIVFVGSTNQPPSDQNPLDYLSRTDMVLDYIVEKNRQDHVVVVPLSDFADDQIWSIQVDCHIAYAANVLKLGDLSQYTVKLYGSRDSFIPRYSGGYTTHFVEIPEDKSHISSTKLRRLIGLTKPVTNYDFRRGVIYSEEKRYPAVFPTVDIAVINDGRILLGRKNGEVGWRFPGGFVDPSDNSFMEAALRELNEEVKGIQTTTLYYIDSVKVDDSRYRDTKHKLITSLYYCYYYSGEPKASDDLVEVKWVGPDDKDIVIYESHKILLEMVLNRVLGVSSVK